MRRVIVIGSPGSGKSMFSRALHEITGLPLYHPDCMYRNPGRTAADSAVFQARLADVLRSAAWILDGNYQSTLSLRMQACDTVFFLDYPPEVCIRGVRARRGKAHPDLPWTEPSDEEDEAFLDFIRRYPSESRPAVLALLRQHPDREQHIFGSRDEAALFLSRLRNASAPDTAPIPQPRSIEYGTD